MSKRKRIEPKVIRTHVDVRIPLRIETRQENLTMASFAGFEILTPGELAGEPEDDVLSVTPLLRAYRNGCDGTRTYPEREEATPHYRRIVVHADFGSEFWPCGLGRIILQLLKDHESEIAAMLAEEDEDERLRLIAEIEEML